MVKENLQMPRLVLKGQERFSQERKRGRACTKAESLRETAYSGNSQVVCIAKIWGIRETEQLQREQNTKGLVW